jgi:response regulator NasT
VKILLADDDADRANSLSRALGADPTLQIVRVGAAELLADAVAAHVPDVVLVDMARPDRDALEGVRAMSARVPHPVVLFVDEDDPGFMEAAIDAGVSSYNVARVATADVKPILRAAVALFRRHRQTHADLEAANGRLRERAVVDRAKALLIRERKLSEPDAYRWLRKQAMGQSRKIADIAAALLLERGEDLP